jgi:hypothetical protein
VSRDGRTEASRNGDLLRTKTRTSLPPRLCCREGLRRLTAGRAPEVPNVDDHFFGRNPEIAIGRVGNPKDHYVRLEDSGVERYQIRRLHVRVSAQNLLGLKLQWVAELVRQALPRIVRIGFVTGLFHTLNQIDPGRACHVTLRGCDILSSCERSFRNKIRSSNVFRAPFER